MIEKLKERIAELEKALEHSIVNHNALVGALQEAKHIYDLAQKAVPVAVEIIDAIS